MKRAREEESRPICLAFASVSTGDFKVDADKAGQVVKACVERFFHEVVSKEDRELIQLKLVEPIFSPILKKVPMDGQNGVRFQVKAGNLVDEKAWAIATGSVPFVQKLGESKANIGVRKHFGVALFEKMVKEQWGDEALEIGQVCALNVAGKYGFKYVLSVLGPNMNPARSTAGFPVCANLNEALEKLELSYMNVFRKFYKLYKEEMEKKNSMNPNQAVVDILKNNNKKQKTTQEMLKSINQIGLGTLPLGVTYCDGGRPTASEAEKLIHEALDCGVQFFDCADSYGVDGSDFHYVEKLVTRALKTYKGEQDINQVIVATKGGMMRLHAASTGWRQRKMDAVTTRKIIEDSCRALEGRIDLWQFHHIPTSLDQFREALMEVRKCQDEGLIDRVGLCNCTVEEIKEARKIVEISTVQNEYSPWKRVTEKPMQSNLSGGRRSMRGVLQYCKENNIYFLPHGMFGGTQARNGQRGLAMDFAGLKPLAMEKKISVHGLLLSFMKAKHGRSMLFIPGARNLERVRDQQRANTIELSENDMKRIETTCFP